MHGQTFKTSRNVWVRYNTPTPSLVCKIEKGNLQLTTYMYIHEIIKFAKTEQVPVKVHSAWFKCKIAMFFSKHPDILRFTLEPYTWLYQYQWKWSSPITNVKFSKLSNSVLLIIISRNNFRFNTSSLTLTFDHVTLESSTCISKFSKFLRLRTERLMYNDKKVLPWP